MKFDSTAAKIEDVELDAGGFSVARFRLWPGLSAVATLREPSGPKPRSLSELPRASSSLSWG